MCVALKITRNYYLELFKESEEITLMNRRKTRTERFLAGMTVRDVLSLHISSSKRPIVHSRIAHTYLKLFSA